jgi:hypothetical protein
VARRSDPHILMDWICTAGTPTRHPAMGPLHRPATVHETHWPRNTLLSPSLAAAELPEARSWITRGECRQRLVRVGV